MKVNPKKLMPQSARDDILCFLASCGIKVNYIKIITIFILISEVIQTILLLLK